jgi:hypothetical protein
MNSLLFLVPTLFIAHGKAFAQTIIEGIVGSHDRLGRERLPMKQQPVLGGKVYNNA